MGTLKEIFDVLAKLSDLFNQAERQRRLLRSETYSQIVVPTLALLKQVHTDYLAQIVALESSVPDEGDPVVHYGHPKQVLLLNYKAATSPVEDPYDSPDVRHFLRAASIVLSFERTSLKAISLPTYPGDPPEWVEATHDFSLAVQDYFFAAAIPGESAADAISKRQVTPYTTLTVMLDSGQSGSAIRSYLARAQAELQHRLEDILRASFRLRDLSKI